MTAPNALRILSLCSLVLGCGSGSKSLPDALAVGAYLGGGSSAFGPSSVKCTYAATPPAIVELSADRQRGTVVGVGRVTRTCDSGVVTTYDTVAPAGAKIVGEPNVKIGVASDFSATPVKGGRELTSEGTFEVRWSFGPDCAVSATTEVDMPAGGDSLHGSYHLSVIGKAKGSCTITGEVLAQKTSLVLTIR